MQTVARRETVEVDASTSKPKGSAALRSLGRHATLAGWTPAIPFQYRAPNPLTLHGSDNGRATRAVLAVVAAVRAPCLLLLDAGHRTGCPPAFSVLAAGLCPRCITGPWADLSPFRASNDLRLPRQRTDPVGGVRLAGLRLDARPHVLRRGPQLPVPPWPMLSAYTIKSLGQATVAQAFTERWQVVPAR